MHRRSWLLSVLLGGAALALSPPVLASLFEPVRDRQLVCESTAIIRGKVTDARSDWDAQHQAIWTTAIVQIDAVHRGSLSPGMSITVKEVGGTVGSFTLAAEGFPTFTQGEEVVLLLRPWEDDPHTYRVWGYGRGKFTLTRRDGRGPTAIRADVDRSGRPTMFTDRLPPASVLGELEASLDSLAKSCGAGGAP